MATEAAPRSKQGACSSKNFKRGAWAFEHSLVPPTPCIQQQADDLLWDRALDADPLHSLVMVGADVIPEWAREDYPELVRRLIAHVPTAALWLSERSPTKSLLLAWTPPRR